MVIPDPAKLTVSTTTQYHSSGPLRLPHSLYSEGRPLQDTFTQPAPNPPREQVTHGDTKATLLMIVAGTSFLGQVASLRNPLWSKRLLTGTRLPS